MSKYRSSFFITASPKKQGTLLLKPFPSYQILKIKIKLYWRTFFAIYVHCGYLPVQHYSNDDHRVKWVLFDQGTT
jgi:hypothetical protein